MGKFGRSRHTTVGKQHGARALRAGELSKRHTLRICNTYCFSAATVVARTRLSVTSFVYCVSCLVITLNFFEIIKNIYIFLVSSTYFGAPGMATSLALVTLQYEIRPLRLILGQANPVPYTDALFYLSSRPLWGMQIQLAPYSSSALVQGGWTVPRPGLFNPEKALVLNVQEAGLAWGPDWMDLLNLLPPLGFEPLGSSARSESLYRLRRLDRPESTRIRVKLSGFHSCR